MIEEKENKTKAEKNGKTKCFVLDFDMTLEFRLLWIQDAKLPNRYKQVKRHALGYETSILHRTSSKSQHMECGKALGFISFVCFFVFLALQTHCGWILTAR